MNNKSPAPDLYTPKDESSLEYLNVLMESWFDRQEEPNKVTEEEMNVQEGLYAQLSQREQIKLC